LRRNHSRCQTLCYGSTFIMPPVYRQLTLDDARTPAGRGGWRPRAGRPRGRTRVPHTTRERFAARHPLHVTLRVVDGLPSLRRKPVVAIVRDVLRLAGHHADFRVVEFNTLSNHLHLVVEAAGQAALARRMQGLMVRLARRLNKHLGRRGRLFAERYHARVLRTPREVRAVLQYVLCNARHHSPRPLSRYWVDPYSSGPWFTGWREPIRIDPDWLRALRRQPRPTAQPTTWLLATGWRRHGHIGFDGA
jgi:REP element-mobilizing transposase RayT